MHTLSRSTGSAFCLSPHLMKEENESEILCQYFPNLPNNKNWRRRGGLLKIVAGHTPNSLTHNVQTRSVDLSDSQAKF